MDSPTDRPAAPDATVAPLAGSRQRWRLTFARAVAADGETLAGREYIALWETALADCGLAVATTDAGRYRFALGAPLPARTAGRAELADLWLTERAPAWQVRQALKNVLPPSHDLVALEDIWLGAPALAGRVAAADYVVALRPGVDGGAIAAAAARVLAADRLIRERAKGGSVKTYDLRPLLVSIEAGNVSGDLDQGLVVRIRTRIHPELGSGRPEEVIAALADELGSSLEPLETIRERLVLAEDLETRSSRA